MSFMLTWSCGQKLDSHAWWKRDLGKFGSRSLPSGLAGLSNLFRDASLWSFYPDDRFRIKPWNFMQNVHARLTVWLYRCQIRPRGLLSCVKVSSLYGFRIYPRYRIIFICRNRFRKKIWTNFKYCHVRVSSFVSKERVRGFADSNKRLGSNLDTVVQMFLYFWTGHGIAQNWIIVPSSLVP